MPPTAQIDESRRWTFQQCKIIEHTQIASSTWQVTVHAPELSRKMVPGQFAMLRISNRQDAILGRAFAMWDRTFDATGPVGVQFVYLAKGRMTMPLSSLPSGSMLDVWGPLGNGFQTSPVDHLVLVAGGVGQTPMLTLALEALGKQRFGEPFRACGYAKKVTLCYGARSKNYLAGLTKFEQSGLNLLTSTEDGSHGIRGRVTEGLRQVLSDRNEGESMRIACCGPEPMMEAVAEIAAQANVACDVSLETPMACGIGICFSCVAKVKQEDGDWDYRRTCIEGPVFDANQIAW